MKPNTPMKITTMIHITTWCSQSMSCAIFDAGVWKYQAIACAAPETAAAAKPAKSAAMIASLHVAFPE